MCHKGISQTENSYHDIYLFLHLSIYTFIWGHKVVRVNELTLPTSALVSNWYSRRLAEVKWTIIRDVIWLQRAQGLGVHGEIPHSLNWSELYAGHSKSLKGLTYMLTMKDPSMCLGVGWLASAQGIYHKTIMNVTSLSSFKASTIYM